MDNEINISINITVLLTVLCLWMLFLRVCVVTKKERGDVTVHCTV
jgi:hypothetical protein